MMRRSNKIIILNVAILVIAGVALGEGWEIEIVDQSGDVGEFTSIALDSNGNPHISYYDSSYDGLKYARNDGSSWDISTVDTTATYGTSTSIDIDGNDYPHIAYNDESNNVMYARWDGNSWQIETVDYSSCHPWPSIALDSGGNPHIPYWTEPYQSNRLNYAYYDGSAWQIDENVMSTSHCTDFTSIVIDSEENPHIVANDGYVSWDVMYAYFDGSTWQTDSGLVAGKDSDIAVDSHDYPHISYYYFGNHDNDLRYIKWDGSEWQSETVDATGDVGEYTSIALDGNDYPHISYIDFSADNLKYAKWNGNSWQIESVDISNDVGKYNSIALDSSGNPHISYYDAFNGNLKYAHYVPADVEDDDTPNTPTGFALYSAVPNPNDGSAAIGFALPRACAVELSLFDIKGRKIATLAEGTHQPGEYTADATGLSSGVYIYEMTADEFSDSKKMVVK